jgi:hypothetical protein
MSELMMVWLISLLATVAPAQSDGGARTGAGPAVVTPSTTPAQTEMIDQFCDGLVPMTKEKKSRRLFGLLQKDERDKGAWTEFKREQDLNAAIEKEWVLDMAQVWSREDGAMAVSMRFTSGSGDWFHFVEYCFRGDGTLARLHSSLNTFNAAYKDPNKEVNGAIRERERYFDSGGKQIKVTKRILDLHSQRPAPTLEIMDDEKEPIYKAAAALPFHRLLKAHDAAHPGVAPGGASPRR